MMPRVTEEVMENHLRTLCYRSKAHVLTAAACRAEADRVPQAR